MFNETCAFMLSDNVI